MMTEPRSLPLSGSEPAGSCHACAFFLDPEEEYRALLPFSRRCAHLGEKCLHFVDPLMHTQRIRRLAEAGIDTGGGGPAGRLEIRTWDDAYLHHRCFNQDSMLSLIEQTLRDGRNSFGRARLWANMEWALEGLPGCDDLIEYESRLNPLIEQHNDIVVCVYALANYGASMVMDILRTHPMVVVGESVEENPFYVPTDRFLEDLKQRRAPRPGLHSASE